MKMDSIVGHGQIASMKNSSYLRVTLMGMALNGIWVPKSLGKSFWILRVLFYIYAVIFQLFMFSALLFIQLLYLIQVRDDLGKMAEISVLFLTHVAQLMKTLYIWLWQERIKKLLEILDGPVFNPTEPKKQAVLDFVGQRALLASVVTQVSSLFTGLMWGVIPTLKPKLTLPLGYPDVETDSPWFKPLYAYETISITLNAVGDAAEDFIAGGLMALVSAQLHLLSDELMTIGVREGKKDKVKLVPKTIMSSKVADEDLKKAVSCAKLHQTLISLTEELNAIFGVPVTCQFAASSFIICTTAFKITTSHELLEISTMILYLICILMELLVYCFSGNLVLHKSQEVAMAAYNSGWGNTSPKTRRILQLIILRAQRPLSVSAGKIFHLSLVTFTKILKTSYSFFAVLNQTQRN